MTIIRRRTGRSGCWGWREVSNIQLDQLASTIQQSLELYSKRVLDGVDEAAKTAIDEMVQSTKQRSTHDRRATGKYARAHASQVGENSTFSRSRIWYVRPNQHTLAHLLNNGHRTRSGGHVSGDHHITNAAERAMSRFEDLVKAVIQRESD